LRGLLFVSAVLSAPVLQPSDVFEQPPSAVQKKIEFHIAVPEAAASEKGREPCQSEDEGRGKGP